MKLGQSDLVSFLMVLAIPGDGKLGQVDLINSSVEGYLFGWTKTVLHPKGLLFPDLPGKSVHHSTDEPELHGIENKGYPMEGPHPGVHVENSHPLRISNWSMGPFNPMELHIRLSYFLWDALFGL